MNTIKPKHKILNKALIVIGVIVLLYLIYFISQVLTIRRQILSGNYDWQQYGAETSGAGGANISNRVYKTVTADDPSLGPAAAPVTIVEFSDFQCPFCLKSFPIIRTLTAKYPDQIRFIYRDFPLEDIHSWAKLAAQAGYCAQAQNRFWPLHDKIFQNQNQISEDLTKSRDLIINLAGQAGVNRAQFLTCLSSAAAVNEVEQDIADGVLAGARGTPTWFINGNRVAGVIPAEALESIVSQLLNNNK